MNYLQYIGSVWVGHRPDALPRFLVSGVDTGVRQIVGRDIVQFCRARGKLLFLLDNTQNTAAFGRELEGYRVVDMLSGQVSLCADLLEVSSLQNISRLRDFLSGLGFDNLRAMKVISYLSFVKETERRLGSCAPLTAEVLDEYSGTMLVQWKLERLVRAGKLSQDSCTYLLGKYAEVSGAAADFEMFLSLLSPFLRGKVPSCDMAVHLPVGSFTADKPLQELMTKLMLAYIRHDPARCAVLILDDGKGGDRSFLIGMLKNLPLTASVHMFSNDAFSFDDTALNVVMNTFSVRIYTRHEDMVSAEKIQDRCGRIDVVRKTTSVTVDKRFRANSAWDMLFGTNYTQTETNNAPVREYRFRKETIHSMGAGTGILDCAGNQIPFSF